MIRSKFFGSALWAALAVARDNPERRWFCILDEVNRMATLSAQNSLLSLMDGTGCLSNPSTGESIYLPDNLIVFGTAGAMVTLGVSF